LSAQGCPTLPSVQKLSNEPFAHTPLWQSASAEQGSPVAPDVHFPPKFPTAHFRPFRHWSGAEQSLPALPSLQVPLLALA
jgi:hypothetical protein